MKELFGYQFEEVLGRNVEMLIPNEFRDHHQTLRNNYLQKPSKRSMALGRDLFGSKKDGTTFPLNVGLTPIEIDEETMILGAIVDLTDRKAAELELVQTKEEALRIAVELRQSNLKLEQRAHHLEKLEHAVKSAKIGVWEFDVSDQTVTWDDSMLELYGVNSSEDFLGTLKDWEKYVLPEDLEVFTSLLHPNLDMPQEAQGPVSSFYRKRGASLYSILCQSNPARK